MKPLQILRKDHLPQSVAIYDNERSRALAELAKQAGWRVDLVQLIHVCWSCTRMS